MILPSRLADDYEVIVSDLLEEYDYVVEWRLDAHRLLRLDVDDQATLTVGILYTTWEWVLQSGTEFGFDVDSALRQEGQSFSCIWPSSCSNPL